MTASAPHSVLQHLGAELVLLDERRGVAVARRMGFAATGTLGILDLAARRGMIELSAAFSLLKATNFRYRPELLDRLLLEHRKSSGAV